MATPRFSEKIPNLPGPLTRDVATELTGHLASASFYGEGRATLVLFAVCSFAIFRN